MIEQLAHHHEDQARQKAASFSRPNDWRYYAGDPGYLGTTSCGGIGGG